MKNDVKRDAFTIKQKGGGRYLVTRQADVSGIKVNHYSNISIKIATIMNLLKA